MSTLLQKLSVIPSIYNGNFVDIDEEIKLAYQKYPFPWPDEKQYEHYVEEDALRTFASSEKALKHFLEQFGLTFDFFKDKIVVDLGAGVGWDALCFARNGAKLVYAVDNSQTSLKHGERIAHLLGQKNIKFCRHSLYELDQLAIQADVVIVKGVLHHIFDLPRFVKALKFVTKNGTNLLLAHSSYNSVPGFSHYFYNHLAWVLGGTDLEKRINVGVKIFRGRHWQLTHDLVRHRVNDLTGVFYMARSSGDIIRIFRREGFIIEKIPGQKYQDYYLSLRQHHQQMLIIERKQVLRKSRRLMAIGLIESFQYLAMRSTLMDRWLGFLYKFFFSKPAHLFIAQLGK